MRRPAVATTNIPADGDGVRSTAQRFAIASSSLHLKPTWQTISGSIPAVRGSNQRPVLPTSSFQSGNGRHHGGRRVDHPFQKTPQAVLPCMSLFPDAWRRLRPPTRLTNPEQIEHGEHRQIDVKSSKTWVANNGEATLDRLGVGGKIGISKGECTHGQNRREPRIAS